MENRSVNAGSPCLASRVEDELKTLQGDEAILNWHPPSFYLTRRAVLVSWLLELQVSFGVQDKTVLTCLSVMDRFASSIEFPESLLPLILAACFTIACGYPTCLTLVCEASCLSDTAKRTVASLCSGIVVATLDPIVVCGSQSNGQPPFLILTLLTCSLWSFLLHECTFMQPVLQTLLIHTCLLIANELSLLIIDEMRYAI